jgi:cytidylate kinase
VSSLVFDKAFPVEFITISGPPCSGTTTVSRSLGKRLGWRVIESGPRYRSAAVSSHFDEEATSELSDLQLKQIDSSLLAHVRLGANTIWEGRLSGWFMRDCEFALRILCMAPSETRVARLSERERSSRDEAKRRLLERERNEAALFRRLYGTHCDPTSEELYHVIIATVSNAVEENVDSIITMLGGSRRRG